MISFQFNYLLEILFTPEDYRWYCTCRAFVFQKCKRHFLKEKQKLNINGKLSINHSKLLF